MTHEQDPAMPSDSATAATPAQCAPTTPPPPPRRKGLFGGRLLRGLFISILLLSLVLNIYMGMAIAAMNTGPLAQSIVQEGQEESTVAIWSVSGAIMADSAWSFRQFYRETLADPNVKAVVIRVDSPGGGVAASDEIYAMVRDIRKHGKTVVVSMGGLAASGGYYISAPADVIYAEPTTATGSIGVIAQLPNISGTAEKIGLKMQVIKSTHAQHWKDMLSPFRDIEPRERQRMIDILDQMQARFESVVTDGRGDRLKQREETIEVADENDKPIQITQTVPFNGMIYTAQEALDLGMVDEIGYLSDACDRAADLAGLKSPRIVQYEIRPSLFERLLGASVKTSLGVELQALEQLRTPRFMYMCTLP